MKYSLTLSLKYNNKLMKLFESFNEEMDRVSVKLLKKNNKLVFEIEAKDSVALRSVLNSITKLFTVYEKMDKIGN